MQRTGNEVTANSQNRDQTCHAVQTVQHISYSAVSSNHIQYKLTLTGWSHFSDAGETSALMVQWSTQRQRCGGVGDGKMPAVDRLRERCLISTWHGSSNRPRCGRTRKQYTLSILYWAAVLRTWLNSCNCMPKIEHRTARRSPVLADRQTDMQTTGEL